MTPSRTSLRSGSTAGRATWLVSIHSFTPVYKGVAGPGISASSMTTTERLSAPLIAALRGVGRLVVGVNQPYSPADRVYFTLERHARSRGLPCAMIEIRNDEIARRGGQRRWADLLAGILAGIRLPTDRQAEADRRAPATMNRTLTLDR